jgi:putative glutamine amidotransferase
MYYVIIAADAPFGNYENWLEEQELSAIWTLNPGEAELREAQYLLFPGGCDVNPELYGESNTGCREIDDELDRAQIRLIRKALSLEIPIEGICRGMQIINVALGGSLIQNLATDILHEAINGRDSRHKIIQPKVKGLREVNSSHHQGIARPFDGAIITARAPDGTIESFTAPEMKISAVQWHPERLFS